MGFLKNRKIKNELENAVKENKIARLRAQTALIETFSNSGYSHGGASYTETWAKRWHSSSYSAIKDIEENRKTLRERSRDLAMNSSIAAAATNATRTSVIGPGLSPRPKIDYEFLGISREAAVDLQGKIKKEFALWADTSLCDSADLNNFYELQQIAFRDWLLNGEEFVLLKYSDMTPNMPYQLRLKLIEADRVCTEGSLGEYFMPKRLESGNVVVNGVEINPEGRVVAYHICSQNPEEFDMGIEHRKWTRIEKRSPRTGNPNILHVFSAERAEQYRGVPFLAPVIQSIKQLTRYTEAEIMAAVINAMFTLFVTTETGDDIAGFAGIDEEMTGEMKYSPNAYDDSNEQITLGSGTVNYLKEGEDVKPVETAHPNSGYEGFAKAITAQIGAALEISPEVLMKQFSSNYSASKGALNETWKAFKMRRSWFVRDFCQEIYNLWFAEAVSKGRINAPGFFMDPLIKNAYTQATWNGPTPGHLNPVQDVNAAIARINNGLSTREDEAAGMNGSDYEDNIRTLTHENERLREANGATREVTNGNDQD